jgi:beta-N-acetylhexosaminidase
MVRRDRNGRRLSGPVAGLVVLAVLTAVGIAQAAGPVAGGAAVAGRGRNQTTVSPALAAAPQRPQRPQRSALPPPRPRLAPQRSASTPRRPRIVWDPIPFGPARKAQMVAYVRLHYGSFMKPTWRLINPHVIVIHYTDSPTFQSVWNTFAPDSPDPEFGELPGDCSHFVIDSDGTIYQLVSLGTMCRHTLGLNWTSIGIEHVGYSDAQVLGDRKQLSASLRLVRWLRCKFGIKIKNVIGHNESLSSPYHHEDVQALRNQTHDDFNHADMNTYRALLRQAGPC